MIQHLYAQLRVLCIYEGDLNASEMTMAEEERIQLMILVKEGKLTVQEAVETVRLFTCMCSARCNKNLTIVGFRFI